MKDILSIIVPTYNRKKFVIDAIESVLKQTYRPLEIIVVDDCSTDGTREYLKEKYLKNDVVKLYVNGTNSGSGLSRKLGYNKANGDYLVFLDSDDYYIDRHFFENAIKLLKNRENISFVSSSSVIEYVDRNKKEKNIMNVIGEVENSDYLLHFQQEYKKSSSTFTTVFRKESLERANITDVNMLNDASIYLRALLSGNAYILKSVSGVYRIHSNNLSSHLNAQFIIENLLEKKKIYEEIKRRKLIDNPEEWLKKQVLLTASYFTDCSDVNKEELKKLIYWCKNNINREVSNMLTTYKDKKKKIFIMAYARKNVGDDLFVKMILERYPKTDFFMKINHEEFVDNLSKHSNLHILKGADTDDELYEMNVQEYDGYLYIGGSIFMEGGKVYNLSPKFHDFVKRCKESNKPFFYISSNYGPYQTNTYFELSKANFADCTDICFRDKYSYNLFEGIKSVRYAPDYAFTYQMKKNKKIKNSIGISVINVTKKNDLEVKQQSYVKMLVKNIKEYIEKNYKIYLFSFCEYEGDEITIDAILKEFKGNDNVIPVRYDGNIEEFLDIYGKMEYMICGRFHAMILSCVCRQKMLITSYSDKIDNVVKDLSLNIPIIRLETIEERQTMMLDKFVLPTEKK